MPPLTRRSLRRFRCSDGLAAKWTRGGLVSFLQHPLETRPHGRMPDFNLSETDSTDLADYLLALPRAGNPSAEPPLTVTAKELAEQWHAMGGADGAWSKMSADERRSAVALRQMTAHRCFSCHEFEARSTVSKEAHVEARNPATLADKRLDEVLSGCLAPAVRRKTWCCSRSRRKSERRLSIMSFR